MLSSLLSKLKEVVTPTPLHQPQTAKTIHHRNPKDHNKPTKTTYESLPISVPPTFLSTEPGVTPVPTLTEIHWEKTDVPENKGLYAVVLDGVLTREECKQLKRLAEGSVPLAKWVDCPEEDSGEPSEEQNATGLGVGGGTGSNEGSASAAATKQARQEAAEEENQLSEKSGGSAAAAAAGGGGGGGGSGGEETETKGSKTPWAPALVNVGLGYEVLTPSYRNSSRIIWDQQEVVDRLWARCCLAPGLQERLALLDANTERDARIITGMLPRKDAGETKEVERYANGKNKGKRAVAKDRIRRDGRTGKWEFVNVNKRLRFLRYSPGQFFRAHCDSPYRELDAHNSDRINETLFTIHLYLNDCKYEAPPDRKDETELEGGATALLSADEKRKYDVECKVGRVLIFQHRRVLHAGADVLRGVKYSVRTDIMYREVLEEDVEQKEQNEEQAEKDGKVGKGAGSEGQQKGGSDEK